MQARVDHDICIGSATCVAIAPEVFVLNNDGQSTVIDEKDRTAAEALLREAAENCPVQAISLYDDAGAKVYGQ